MYRGDQREVGGTETDLRPVGELFITHVYPSDAGFQCGDAWHVGAMDSFRVTEVTAPEPGHLIDEVLAN